jgi:hypothetical protein
MLPSLVTVFVGFAVAALAMLYILDWRVAQVLTLARVPNQRRRSARDPNGEATRRETRPIRARLDLDR